MFQIRSNNYNSVQLWPVRGTGWHINADYLCLEAARCCGLMVRGGEQDGMSHVLWMCINVVNEDVENGEQVKCKTRFISSKCSENRHGGTEKGFIQVR